MVKSESTHGNVIIMVFRYRYRFNLNLDLFLFYATFNSLGHIAMDSLRVEESVHTSWSRFCTVNQQSGSNYKLCNLKYQGQDLDCCPLLTAAPLSPHMFNLNEASQLQLKYCPKIIQIHSNLNSMQVWTCEEFIFIYHVGSIQSMLYPN